MLDAMSSLTGGGGLSTSSSSSTGAQGGDSFTQEFGGLNYGASTPSWLPYVVVAVILLVMFFMLRGSVG